MTATEISALPATTDDRLVELDIDDLDTGSVPPLFKALGDDVANAYIYLRGGAGKLNSAIGGHSAT